MWWFDKRTHSINQHTHPSHIYLSFFFSINISWLSERINWSITERCNLPSLPPSLLMNPLLYLSSLSLWAFLQHIPIEGQRERHWHLGVGWWLHPALWESAVWWEASWEGSCLKRSPLVLWKRASCTRPTNKGGTLRGGFVQERMGLVRVGLTLAMGSCKGITGEKINWASPMVYEECYSKVKGMGGLFQTSERSKRAYIRARVCSGGCDYDTGLAHEEHAISISWTKDHGRCHSRGLPLTPLPVFFHCVRRLSPFLCLLFLPLSPAC